MDVKKGLGMKAKRILLLDFILDELARNSKTRSDCLKKYTEKDLDNNVEKIGTLRRTIRHDEEQI